MGKLVVCASIVAALVGCTSNQAGNTGVTELGDITHEAEKGSPIEPLRQACGDGAPTAAGAVLHRQPYLQQVTSTTARIGWVSTAPDGEEVHTSLGADMVGAVPRLAEPEVTQVREVGENQMWARLDGFTPGTIYCYQPWS